MLIDRMSSSLSGAFRAVALVIFALAVLAFPFAMLYLGVRIVRMAWGG